MKQHHNSSTPYLYSVAETGFLQRFWQVNPSLLSVLQSVGSDLHPVGGGITSPDNIVCNGETLLRNYLYGWKKLKGVGLPRFMLRSVLNFLTFDSLLTHTYCSIWPQILL